MLTSSDKFTPLRYVMSIYHYILANTTLATLLLSTCLAFVNFCYIKQHNKTKASQLEENFALGNKHGCSTCDHLFISFSIIYTA